MRLDLALYCRADRRFARNLYRANRRHHGDREIARLLAILRTNDRATFRDMRGTL